MKTPQSASKPQKGGSALSTPTSGKISKNKSTPMSLKAKVLEKNAKLALFKGQDTITLNGKSPKKAQRNAVSPKNQTPKPGSPKQNGTPGKKRKSLELTPNLGNAHVKKPKKTPEVSPEVKLGLKIEKLLESPKDKKPAESVQAGKVSKNQKKKAKKLPQSAEQQATGSTSPGSPKMSKKQKQQEAKKVAQAAAAPPSPGSPGKSKKQKKQEAKKLAQAAEQTKSEGQSPGQGKKSNRHKKKEAKQLAQAGLTASESDQTKPGGPPSPGQGKKSKKQKKQEAKNLAQAGGQAAPKAVQKPGSPPSKQAKKNELKKKMENKMLDKKQQKQKGDKSQKSEDLKTTKQKAQKKGERRPSKGLNESRDNLMKEVTASAGEEGNFPKHIHVENAVKALIEDFNERQAEKPALLDEPAPIVVTVEFYYHPPARGIQRVALPHPYAGSNPDVLFIAVDLKKAKNDPEESIDYHANLFKASGVTSISEILPFTLIRKEHSQYEEKRKLANRSDVFLIDAKIAHRMSAIFPRKLLRHKVPVPVRMHLKGAELKKEISTALRKTSVTLKPNSLSTTIRIGHVGMKVKALVENMKAVAAALSNEKFFPGGKQNIRQIFVKTFKSDSYPVYISIASRNEIPEPKRRAMKKMEVVEGEVSTAGVTVAVHPDGNINITSKDSDSDLDETEHDTSPKKKRKAVPEEGDSDEESEDVDDSDIDGESGDELDPSEVEKFLKANRAEDDSDDDEDSDEGGEIEKAEQEFLLALRKQQDALEAEAKKRQKAIKTGKKDTNVAADDDDEDESDVDEDEDELDDEEDELDDEEDELDDEEDELDEEEELDEEDDEESDGSDVPNLIPAKVAQPKQGKGRKPGQNGPQAKGKPAAQKRSFQKAKSSPKAKRR